jgi:divinyl chlorophyllide a 8-vinyl-reductase
MLGATGTIGRATVRALSVRDHDVVCFVRAARKAGGATTIVEQLSSLPGVTVRVGDVSDPTSLARDGFRGERFNALVSCLASRTGAPQDAWAIDHQAHLAALAMAKSAGVTQMVLLSAICVQKPQLPFQRAKLAFENVLMASGVTWSIVRPTAFFKSLSGQVKRVQRGKPFLVFGDGTLTACKPISDDDLATFLVDCLDDPEKQNCILPIGGPGDALTPRQQGEQLFALLGRAPRFTQVPVRLLDTIVAVLGTLGRAIPPLADKAELARIGRYYATESMLVWDATNQRYDAAATPSFGRDTLADYYARLLRGDVADDRGEHAVF